MDSIDHISQAHLDKLLLRISANPDFQNEIEVLKGEYSLEERIETIISNSKLVPILQDCVEFFDENERGHEIEAWLSQFNCEPESYAILDDDFDFLEGQPIFKTQFHIGITPEIAEQVINHLNQTPCSQT